MRSLKRFFKFISLLTILGSLSILALLVGLYVNLVDVDTLRDIKLQVPLRIYTADHQLIAEFGEQRRIPVHLSEVPPQFINAFIATEDHRFFQHNGVDFVGLLRASVHVIKDGTKSQGGSTITMQVARNFFLSSKKTYSRKLNEILLAIKIEHELSKDQILELYLNKVFLGNRAYGVAAAAEVYYGKTLDQLTLAQFAMIAGLPKAPSTINPIADPVAAEKRRKHVLDNMLEYQYINAQEYQQAIHAPITASYHGTTIQIHAPYIAEMVRQELLNRFGPNAYTEGYQVYTTIDSHLQQTAETTLKTGLLAYDKRHSASFYNTQTLSNTEPFPAKLQSSVEGALVSIHPSDGAILALIGGYNYDQSQFNRVTQASLQPGSNFKPFIYTAALANGFTPATLINDAPIVLKDPAEEALWRPQNDKLHFGGPTTLRTGLIKSLNLVSIRILQSIGIDKAIDYVSHFGFRPDNLPRGLSLALGTANVTPLEIVRGYAILANGGYQITPYFISSIENSNSELIYQAEPAIANKTAQSVIDPRDDYIMNNLLQDAINRGTGRGAKDLKRQDLAGKTGTTQDLFDAWFSGFNSDIATTVWVGFDNPHTLSEYGAQAALPIWKEFMRVALKDKPERSLSQPTGLVTVKIDPKNGLLARSGEKDAVFEIFRQEDAPTQVTPNEETITPTQQNNSDDSSPEDIF